MEKLLNFSLRDLYRQPAPKRARRAVLRLRRLLSKRFHADEADVYLSQKLNELIWAKGFSKVPKVVQLRITIEDNKVRAYLQNETIETPKKEQKKEQKESKKEPKEQKKEPKEKQEKPKEHKGTEKQAKAKEKQEETARAHENKDSEEEAKRKLKEKRLMEKAASKEAIKRKLGK